MSGTKIRDARPNLTLLTTVAPGAEMSTGAGAARGDSTAVCTADQPPGRRQMLGYSEQPHRLTRVMQPTVKKPLWRRKLRLLQAQVRRAWQDETGAVTAEYAILIMAAVAFAGLLVVIMRSAEVQATLTQLVQNALNSVN